MGEITPFKSSAESLVKEIAMLLLKKHFVPGLLALGVLLASPVLHSEVIFEENFDDQPDWTSTMYTTNASQVAANGEKLPHNWDAIYQGTMWSPETGFPNNHASLEILTANSDKARGGIGKSAIFWRESYSRGWQNWASDAQFIKLLGGDHQQLYVEFWIRFDDDWYGRDAGQTQSWTSKLFRIGSWSGSGDMFNGAPAGKGDLGPIVFWDYKRDKYGVRNVLAYRGGPHGENYRSGFDFKEDESRNFNTNIKGMEVGGADPLLVDQIGGGLLKNVSGVVDHEQVFGAGGHWTKMAFFVKMNSSVGAADGVFRQWVNGARIVNYENIPWISKNSENKMVGWNYIALGGNDYFQEYPNDQRHEEWYSIDDLIIRDDIPSDLSISDQVSPPNPPPTVIIK